MCFHHSKVKHFAVIIRCLSAVKKLLRKAVICIGFADFSG